MSHDRTFNFGVPAQEGFDSCGPGLAWYTEVVGETPCSTYERLRRICNPTYRVGGLGLYQIESPTDIPPDICDDQLNECCHNGFSFVLSMLCANCQLGIGDQGTGLDALAGTYRLYLGGTKQDHELVQEVFTERVQSAICDEDIKIFRSLYGVAWTSGAWCYIDTRNTAVLDYIEYGEGAFYDACSTGFQFTEAPNQPPQTLLPTSNTMPMTSDSPAAPFIPFYSELPSLSSTTRMTTSVSLRSGTLSLPPPTATPSITEQPSSIITPENREPSSTRVGRGAGRLVGIAVGSVIGGLLMIGICFLAARRMRCPWKPFPLITPYLGHPAPSVPPRSDKPCR